MVNLNKSTEHESFLKNACFNIHDISSTRRRSVYLVKNDLSLSTAIGLAWMEDDLLSVSS